MVGLLEGDASLPAIAKAAADASARDLARMPDDVAFQHVLKLLVFAPLEARSPGYRAFLAGHGISEDEASTVPGLLAGLGRSVDRAAFDAGHSSDAGEMAKAALLESLSVQLRDRVPTLFAPTEAEIRKALGSFSSGGAFAGLARDFFARLTYRSLDYFLSRELANHTGQGKRFSSDADRTRFQQDLAQHAFEASRIVETYAGGWYGKSVWQSGGPDAAAIDGFARYSLRKLRSELGRRHEES